MLIAYNYSCCSYLCTDNRYTLPITLKDNVLGKRLLANGEGALLYAGGKLNFGPQNNHRDNLYGAYCIHLNLNCMQLHTHCLTLS
jgi:hypothetical protein